MPSEMDQAPTIDRATSEQLIAELMWRKTFFGVIVAVRADATGAVPSSTDPVAVCASQKLSLLLVTRMLAQAIEKVIAKLAMEETRKGASG
jgi:hypothetical protein